MKLGGEQVNKFLVHDTSLDELLSEKKTKIRPECLLSYTAKKFISKCPA